MTDIPKISPLSPQFSPKIVSWQKNHGRQHLPWQTQDPYTIWLSEVMLQQTQVSTVIPYFERFMARFPTVADLAAAPQESVLEAWAGLGYYARARNLHRCAQTVVRDFAGHFPTNAATLETLPGIGRSTAAAIAAFAFGERAAILDGNVRRVLCRHFAIEGFPGEAAVLAKLWTTAEANLPESKDIAAYTQGLMDLGSMVCTRGKPKCAQCPVQPSCLAHQQGRESALPTPKPRKTIPQREVAFLLIKQGGDWLLERRPQRGIWGGLLAPVTLAEEHLEDTAASQAHIRDYLAERGLRLLGQAVASPILSHIFTHFRLHIQPWICEVDVIGEHTLQIVVATDVESAALPTPVKKLLSAL